ncbi:hypothetical protein BV22DRAFT_1029854 [Leucogyrophana mollusca]|uniref:Uncharacterized protein n=1 Tax=Leucogyrophana mollusca TaxID=85980 RepID=A0ACB8BW25_9AGAM|nr:hypothetical protein BV22DRAFT_1029854 [Leucogyrophana mollusca]
MSLPANATQSGVPIDEPAAEVLLDSLNLIGSTVMCGVGYGIVLTLYTICVYFFHQDLKTKRKPKKTWLYLAYLSVMFVLATLYLVSSARTIQLAYVNHRYYGAGPAAYDLLIFSEPITILGSATYVITNVMSDALILWRFIVLYQGARHRFYIIIVPCLTFLTVTALGIINVVQASLPNQSLWSQGAISFAVPYFATSLSHNILTTALMAIRLLIHKKRFDKALGPQHNSPYTTVVAMLVESSALYAIFSIPFLVLFVINSPYSYIFLSTLSQIQVVAPFLIIFRVSQGKAWTRTTDTYVISGMQFMPRSKHTIGSDSTTPEKSL